MSYANTLTLALCSTLLWTAGCGDDATSASGTDGSSTSAPSTTAEPTTTTLTDGPTTDATLTTSGAATSSGATDSTGLATDSASEGTGSTGSGGADASSGSGSSGDDTGSTGSTGGELAVCEMGGEYVLGWSIEVIDGQFPDDLPTDLIADCVLGAPTAANQVRVNCPDLQMYINIDATPAPTLPEEGEELDLRFHRAPGPLGFPDLWLQMDFANGTDVALAASSVLDPTTATLELPWSMAVSEQECGPFNIEDPFGNPDNCGDQMWLGLDLNVMGQSFTTFHGTFASLAAGSTDVDFWVGSARDYGALPKFCDIAPRFFTTMTLSTPQE